MPQVISTTVYTFDELGEAAKQKALEWGATFATDHGWWEFTYEDAENIGCKISAFDTGRAQSIDFKFKLSALEVAHKIKEDHGEHCDTYKLAETFLKERDELVDKHTTIDEYDRSSELDERAFDDECDDLESEFEKDLGQCYLVMLRDNLEYLESEEAITDTLIANEYTFTEDGERFG